MKLSTLTALGSDNVCLGFGEEILRKTMINNNLLIQCGVRQGKHSPDFTIIQKTPGSEIREVFQSDSAMKSYKVSVIQAGFRIEESLNLKKFDPFINFEINCDEKQCLIGNYSCLIKKQTNKISNTMHDLQKKIGKRESNPPFVDTLITNAFNDALAGNKKAKNFFKHGMKGLGLDGGASETYMTIKGDISRLKKAKCW